uniref:Uncharacterized protein n=1 Tax=Bacteriophage sp. TaxID=38018 RepID=A0A8D9PEW5_9VIRU|nr:MAG TPA: hypothetical protein [Bacteriophage sp.]
MLTIFFLYFIPLLSIFKSFCSFLFRFFCRSVRKIYWFIMLFSLIFYTYIIV